MSINQIKTTIISNYILHIVYRNLCTPNTQMETLQIKYIHTLYH